MRDSRRPLGGRRKPRPRLVLLYFSVTDFVLDPTKPLVSIELRCVATETLLGVIGLTLLDAM